MLHRYFSFQFLKKATKPRSRGGRGFTLVELMVAMTGSLFFTVFVFMLSRDVGRYFQAQSRTSDTTLAALTGFERLRLDIARAGFLSSANLARDQNRCPRSSIVGVSVAPDQGTNQFSGLPGIQKMALLGIDASPATLTNLDFYATWNNAKLAPQVLTLWGSYSAAEQFRLTSIDLSTNPPTLVLEKDSEALRRVGISTIPNTVADPSAVATTDTEGTAILQRIFRAGTIIRVVDESNREQYAIARQANYSAGTATITLENTPALQQKASGNTCGIRGHGTGLAINPVNIIRYEIAQVKPTAAANHPHLQYLYEGAAPSYDDNARFDLMRYEIPASVDRNATVIGATWPNGSAVAATGEIVAEYAVDLAFGLTVMTDYQTGGLTTYEEGDPLIDTYAGNPIGAAQSTPTSTTGPHFIRGVNARLAVRYRDADRETSILPNPTLPTVTAAQILRVKVSDENQFARTRGLQSYIATHNTRNLTW